MNEFSLFKNVIFALEEMETNDKPRFNIIESKNSENTEQKLLKELIKSVEDFVTNKELRSLSESFKKVFYHGLSLDNHVSEPSWSEHRSLMSHKCNAVKF